MITAGVMTQQTQPLDDQVLVAWQAMPAWLRELSRDMTGLGSEVLLPIFAVIVGGLLALQRQYRQMSLVAASLVTATVVLFPLKAWVGRPRPQFEDPTLDLSSGSFPSGHAMLATVVYLLLGWLLTQRSPGVVRWYVLGWLIVVVALIGLSRILLGVHYLTDVLGGWALGGVWVAAFWLLWRRVCQPRQ